MNKVLLINPEFNIPKATYETSISVGLLSIATYLDSKGFRVEIIDGARQENYLELIKQKIVGCQYAGLSVMTTQISNALLVSRMIKEINPECQVVWGGTHPTFFLEQVAGHELVDIAVYGEGEYPMFDLISGRKLSAIKGIAYKEGGKVKVNPRQELINLAEMPLFNWDLLPREILNNPKLIIPSLTSRGCPHRCTFCINAILKNRWRARPAEQVLEDLRIIKSKEYFKGKNLRFWDENFFVDMNRAKKIIDGIIKQGLVTPWETTVRVNYIKKGSIDDEFMAKLRKSGCYLLSFGAESGSPAILKKIQKDIEPEEIINSAKTCLANDVIPQYSFMVGLPGESKKDMLMTFGVIDRLVHLSGNVQILGPQAFRPYPGSPLYDECVESGWSAPGTLEEWADMAKHELSYLTVKNFPWVKHKGFVEAAEAYVRFGAHTIKSSMGSTVRANKILKLGFVLICKLRWKLKFFAFPFDYKLAKRAVAK